MDENESKAGRKIPGDSGTASGGAEERDALLEKLNRAQAIAHVGDWEWEIATNKVSWSDELYRIYGFEPGEIPPDYELVLRQMHPSSKDEFLKAIDDALNEDRPFEMEYRFLRKDGTESCLHTIGEVIRDRDGSPLKMQGIVRDVTECKQVEEEEILRGRFIESIVDLSPDILYIYDLAERRNIYSNEGISSVLGFSPEEVRTMGGRLLSDLMDPEDFKSYLAETVPRYSGAKDGERIAHRYRMRHKSGSWHWLDCTELIYRRNPDGSPRQILGVAHDVTERIRAEEELKAQERRLADSQRIAHVGSWEHNLETNQVFWSDELFRLLGLDPEEDSEDFDMFFGMVHPDDQLRLKKSIEKTLESHIPFNIDYRFVLKDGTTRIINAQAELLPDSSGKVVILSGTAQDISERTLTEERIRKSESRLRESQEVAKIGSWSWDVLNNTLEWSDETFRRFDKDPATFTPTPEYFVSLIHPDDSEGVRKAIEESLTHDAPYHIQPRIRNESGREWVLEGFGRVERDGEGKPVRFAGTAQDITVRKNIEGALKESEILYRNLVETTAAIAWEVDLASLRFTYISPQVEELTGYPPEAWAGFSFWADKIHPDDREEAVAFCQAETGKGLDHTFEYRMAAADGSTLWIRDVVSVIKDQGRPVTLRGFFIDITASKMAAEKLRESEELVRRILDTMDAGVISVDRDYRINSANKAFCSQVGRSASDVIGKHCYEVTHGSFRPCYEEGEECAVRQVFEDGETHVALHHHTDPEGSTMYVETKAFPVKDPSGNVVSAIEMIVNITEKHLLEGERLKAQKLESIGTLAGGIAHDFNNLLQGVFGHISMARMGIDRKEESLAMLEQAEKALHQAVSLTNQLLTFAKGGKPVKEPVPILSVIENAARFSLSGSSCDYEILPQDDLWQVNGDAGQIGQVIQNVVLNADQSMPQGGRIRITVRNVPSGSERPPALEKGDFVLISIADNGPGIPDTLWERIFDPYFTTKERGSGLGLATSYSIVQNHGGIIDVDSKPGEGATLAVYLPAIMQRAPETAAAAAPAGTRFARVLVMDDEEMIRRITGKLLRSLGHECELAEEGGSAISMFKAARDEGRPFDLVLLDQTVRGGMGGSETMKRLRAIDPEVKAIASSGYSDDATLSEYQEQGFSMFLKKPYNVEELSEAISSALG